jgi:hypothetical protein
MSVAELWTAFSLLGFLVAVVGAYFARLEYHESKKDYQFSDRAGTRLLARDQLRQRKTTYARLIIFALVMVGYTAVGAIAMSLPPPPSQTAEATRVLLALILVSGEVLLVFAKIMDLYTLYQQRQARATWDRNHTDPRSY